METTKTRDLPFIIADPVVVHAVNGKYLVDKVHGPWNVVGKQSTTSSGHPWPPSGEQRNRDIGGAFLTTKHLFESNLDNKGWNLHQPMGGAGWDIYMSGRLNPWFGGIYPSSAWPAPFSLTTSQLIAMGSTAISRTLPTNSIADAAQFLGELKRDGLPSLPGLQSMFGKHKTMPQKGSSELLNLEFALKPFISDLKKFAKAAKTYESVLQQYTRDSGKNVRRQYAFPLTVETSEEVVPYNNALPWPCNGTLATDMFATSRGHTKYTITTHKKREVTFSGCYTYYLDPGSDARSKAGRFAQKADKLFGVRVTPSLVWELAPWSWAVDWVSNVGDVIDNFSAFQRDGLVLRYGYIMEKSTSTITRNVTGLRPLGTGPSEVTEKFTTVSKRRIPATPYGFGLDPAISFTPRQWSILTALAISHDGRKIGM